MKKEFTQNVTLKFPDFTKPFFLTTDASNNAIGGVLQQKDDMDRLRPLSFFSRKLNKAEMNYSTIEREALAIVYGLKINRDLCLGYQIFVQTDHRPFIWLLTTSNANSRIARWQLSIAEFYINVDYIPGNANKVADHLSRLRELNIDDIDEQILVISETEEHIVD